MLALEVCLICLNFVLGKVSQPDQLCVNLNLNDSFQMYMHLHANMQIHMHKSISYILYIYIHNMQILLYKQTDAQNQYVNTN